MRLAREEDELFPLSQRVDNAHQYQADLFIPITCRWLYQPDYLGRVGIRSVQSGNAADNVAGGKNQNQDNCLQQVLFELVQTDTINNMLTLGRHMIGQIRPVCYLYSDSTAQATFAVL